MSSSKKPQSTQQYAIPGALNEVEYQVKKSRFIARAAYAPDRDQAMQVLEQARLDYPDARHHCWAYLIGPPQSPATAAMSDDGEPGGTAGKPILNVLQHKDVGDVMLVVIRYFGGIKLGAGGLVRAYSQAAQQVMESLQFSRHVPSTALSIECDFSQEQVLRHWFAEHGGSVDSVDYRQQVMLYCTLPLSMQAQWSAFAQALSLDYRWL